MRVSSIRGIRKSSILIRFSIKTISSYWGTPMTIETPIWRCWHVSSATRWGSHPAEIAEPISWYPVKLVQSIAFNNPLQYFNQSTTYIFLVPSWTHHTSTEPRNCMFISSIWLSRSDSIVSKFPVTTSHRAVVVWKVWFPRTVKLAGFLKISWKRKPLH